MFVCFKKTTTNNWRIKPQKKRTKHDWEHICGVKTNKQERKNKETPNAERTAWGGRAGLVPHTDWRFESEPPTATESSVISDLITLHSKTHFLPRQSRGAAGNRKWTLYFSVQGNKKLTVNTASCSLTGCPALRLTSAGLRGGVLVKMALLVAAEVE